MTSRWLGRWARSGSSFMSSQIQEFTRGSHNHIVKVAGYAKAASQTSSDPDEKTLTSYIAQLGTPDSPD